MRGPIEAWEGAIRTDLHPVIGTLKGYDQLMNLVLDEVKEALTGMSALHQLEPCANISQTTKATSATANSA